MTEISAVLPAYQVQGYLRECLDSILGGPFADLEVIAVDDRSPDGCGAIMDEYASVDARVRVIHLERNVGLGEARNIGLDHATGEYVWFIDSDDWLADGALQAVHERLQQTKPDVLCVDYARAYWWGKVERDVLNHLFREPPPPEVFTLHERPSALGLLMTAWNKVIRRQFLIDLGVRFGRGYYEDLPVTYPVLLAAERISLLDRVCYYYRQRREGAITRTSNRQHLDVFAQYEKVFAFMDRHGTPVEEFRLAMFGRMMWHYLIILGRGDRVPRAARREFFDWMSVHYRRYAPAGFVPPHGLEGLKYPLVCRDAYRTFTMLKAINKTRLTLRTRVRGVRKVARLTGGKGVGTLRRAYYRVQLRLPMEDHLATYAAYWYRGYACNPAAIYEKARELAPGVRGVWVVSADAAESMPDGVDYVLAGTLPYYRMLARAKYLINNVNYPNEVVKRPGSVHVQTHHGTPVKTMGLDQRRYPVGANQMSFKSLLQRCDRWDFSVTSNRFSTQMWAHAYPCHFEELEYGYPRNDRLFTADTTDVAAVRARLGLAPDATVILYAPTFRDYQRDYVPMPDLRRLAAVLGPRYTLLVRAHYFVPETDGQRWPERGGRIIDVSAYPRVTDLCLAADVLLTDYSSIMFDYANLDRPIVIYAPDWHTYRLTRGVYFDLLAEPPGTVATRDDELVEAFGSGAVWGADAAKARAEFRRRFCEFDDGHAAERVVRRVFLGAHPTGDNPRSVSHPRRYSELTG